MQFALTTQANDGAAASINGAPIFLGVTVGSNGIAFEGRTINVGSKGDEDFLARLESLSDTEVERMLDEAAERVP